MQAGLQDLALTKIVATLGPASAAPETIRLLIEEGVRCFRLNFSHGTLEEHERSLAIVRRASEETGIHVAVLGDLSGPKIRVGDVVEGGVLLESGARVEFRTEPRVADNERIFSVSYAGFVEEVGVGQRVLLDDGNVRAVCVEKTERAVICVVKHGGVITSHKGVNLPDTDLSAPALTEKDERCVKFAVRHRFDALALSFVRRAEDVRQLKTLLNSLGAPTTSTDDRDLSTDFMPVISKIEKPEAIEDLTEILRETDMVMIARGDLGVEMDLAEVAVLQKRITHLCHDEGIPVIVATQMLQSMIDSPTPTRAEVSDVANAIFDRVDAVMLSGETAVGRWPAETVRMMCRIARKSNDYLRRMKLPTTEPKQLHGADPRSSAVAEGVMKMVQRLDAKLIVGWAQLGGGVYDLTKHHLPRPILAFGPDEPLLRRLAVLYGVVPMTMSPPADPAEFLRRVDEAILKREWAERGDPIVVVLGDSFASAGTSNTVGIHLVGERA